MLQMILSLASSLNAQQDIRSLQKGNASNVKITQFYIKTKRPVSSLQHALKGKELRLMELAQTVLSKLDQLKIKRVVLLTLVTIGKS